MAQLMLNVTNTLEILRTKQSNISNNDQIEVAIGNIKKHLFPYIQELFAQMEIDNVVSTSLISYLQILKSQPERAWFVDLASQISSATPKQSLPIMASVELRYLATMILDDIADRSTERCGQPTLHIREGISQAMYLSEVLMGMAQRELSKALNNVNLDRKLAMQAFSEWIDTHIKVNAAQYRDVIYEEHALSEVTTDMSLKLIEWTTAVEVANCFFLGGLMSSKKQSDLDCLREIGLMVGMMMQIRDDLLDFADDAALLNKEPLLDLKYGKKKVPIVFAFHHASAVNRHELARLTEQGGYNRQDMEKIRDFIFNPAAISHLVTLTEEYVKKTERLVKNLVGPKDAKEVLMSFVRDYLRLHH